MFNILRNICFYLTAIPVTIYYILTMNIMLYLTKNKSWGEKLGSRWGKGIMRFASINLEFDLTALTPGEHYIFMVNHTSNLDICALYFVLGRAGWPLRFLAKKSLFHIPFFGYCMRSAGHIPVDRSNHREGMKSIAKAIEITQAGACPVMFPEGTRSTELSRLQAFKTGGMLLALKSKVPVAPIIIEGMGDVLPKGKLRIQSGQTVRIKALAPINSANYTPRQREEFKNDLFQVMNTEYQKMRSQRGETI